MANSIKTAFHSELATVVLNEILYQRANYYYYLGKLEKWASVDISPASEPTDSYADSISIRNNMIYVKRITANDVSLVVEKHDWQADTVYDYWDNRKPMNGLKFYCVTTDYNVYKCLDNAGGQPSTEMPAVPELSPYNAFKTADGYTWKYMYNVPPFKRLKFKSVYYVPVQRAISDSFYNKGSVDAVVVVDGGSGYTDVALTYITVTPNGAGSGAILAPIVSKDDRPEEKNSAGEVVLPARPSGTLLGVKIINGGTNYTPATTLSVVDAGDGLGVGIFGNSTAIIKPIIQGGVIVNVTIEDPGKWYSVGGGVTVTVTGDGENASFSPVVYDGSVIDVIVENAGNGYSYIVLTISSSNGSGAVIRPVLGVSDFASDQSIIEQTTVEGAIHSIQVINGGSNYSSGTAVSVNGDWELNSGSACLATPVIVGGVLTSITVTQFGAGYNYANVIITDTTGTGAIAEAILPPIGGHGKDAVEELLCDTLAINSSLWQDNLLNRLNQDYRQYGILKNPTAPITNQTFRTGSALLAYEVVLDNVVGLVDLLNTGTEDVLMLDDKEFRVIAVIGNTVTLQPIGINNVIPNGTLVSATTANVYTVSALSSQPIMNKYSGKLVYASNESPFSFTENQGIVIKTFLKF